MDDDTVRTVTMIYLVTPFKGFLDLFYLNNINAFVVTNTFTLNLKVVNSRNGEFKK